MIDVLFVNAASRKAVYGGLARFSAVEPPVWAGLLARFCQERGHSAAILDAEAFELNPQQTAFEILRANPRLCVFPIYGHQPSASTQSLPAARDAVNALRHISHDHIPTLALGTHIAALPERTLQEEPFDFLCTGEGPATLDALIVALWAGMKFGSLIPAHLSPPGLLWRNKSGTGCSGSARLVNDLDKELPGQAWWHLNMKKYRAHNWHLWSGDPAGGYASVQTSLGCPFKCSFCAINAPFTSGGAAPKLRKWSPVNVVDQITTLVRVHGITNIRIPDEMFCLDRQHVKEICGLLIAAGLGAKLNMWAYARVDTVKDEEMLLMMRDAGFRWLGIGVESGSKHVRDGVEKGRFGNEEIIAAVRRVQAAGIYVGANYIFGLPDDTAESCAATYNLAVELDTEWANFYCAMAYPGSGLHREAQQRGWALPEDKGGPGWLGYSQHAYEALPLRTEALSAEELLDIRDGAFMAYFSRPAYHEKIAKTFGARAVLELNEILAAGQPRRKHRERQS